MLPGEDTLEKKVNITNTRLDGDWFFLHGAVILGVILIDLVDGSSTDELVTFESDIQGDSTFWDGERNRFYTLFADAVDFAVWRTFKITKPNIGSVDLDDIIREICVRVGLVEGVDFDVSAVTGSVWGWKIINRIKANEALGNILGPFFLQAGIQDGLINFITRHEISQVTIHVGDFLQDLEDE